MQLSRLKFSKEVKTTLILADDIPIIQKHIVKSMMILLRITLDKEFCQHSTTINTVTTYYKFQEGGIVIQLCKRLSTRRASLTLAKKADLQLVAIATKKQALNVAMLVVYQQVRPTIYFICLGELGLLFSKYMYSFASLGDLTKHFKQKHLANYNKGD